MPTIRDRIGLKEIRTKLFFKQVMIEFIGTACLILAGCGAAVTMEGGEPVHVYLRAWTFAMTVTMIVWSMGHVSGAHINPSVSISFMITGHISIIKSIVYVIAQCAGGITGAGILWYMLPDDWRGKLGSTVFAEGIGVEQGFAVEAVCTFFLLVGVYASSDRLRTDHAGSIPLAIGVTVYVPSAWAGNLTGASMNPARTLGPALISGAWCHHWVYWAAPVVGGVMGALFYHHVLAETAPEVADHLHSNQVIGSNNNLNLMEKEENSLIETVII